MNSPNSDLHALPAEELNRIAAVEGMGWSVDTSGGYKAGTFHVYSWDPYHDIRDAKALDQPGDLPEITELDEGGWECCRIPVVPFVPYEPEHRVIVTAPTEERARTIAAILAHRARKETT